MNLKEFAQNQEKIKIDNDLKRLDVYNLIECILSDNTSDRVKRYIIRQLTNKCEKYDRIAKIIDND